MARPPPPPFAVQLEYGVGYLISIGKGQYLTVTSDGYAGVGDYMTAVLFQLETDHEQGYDGARSNISGSCNQCSH